MEKIKIEDWLKAVIIEELIPMLQRGEFEGQVELPKTIYNCDDMIYDVCADVIDACASLQHKHTK